MTSLATRTTDDPTESVRRDLTPLAVSRLLEPAWRADHALTPLGATAGEPELPMLWQEPHGGWWAFADHLSDPTALQYGGVVVPDEVRDRLTRLLATGFAPDMVVIGHEMPPDWTPGLPLPKLVPGTRPKPTPHITRERFAEQTLTAGLTFGRVLLGTAAAAASIGTAAGVGVAALMENLARLDPVILAGLRHPNLPVYVWVEVERWAW